MNKINQQEQQQMEQTRTATRTYKHITQQANKPNKQYKLQRLEQANKQLIRDY